MSKLERFARIILKRTSIPELSATTAPSDDYTLSTPEWSESDIYEGEFFMNLEDEKLWIRTGHNIKKVLFEGDISVSTSIQYKLSALNTAPASATATGTLGEIRVTATAIYVCTATDTWVKADLATWV